MTKQFICNIILVPLRVALNQTLLESQKLAFILQAIALQYLAAVLLFNADKKSN